MSKSKRTIQIVLASITAVVLVVAALIVFRSGSRPVCHRAISGALEQWMLETGHTNDYPNASGLGSNSLAMIEPLFGHAIQRYAYVPGLRPDDPEGLILMYLRTQTHYTWHGDSGHSIFTPLRWMVVSPQIQRGTCPEGGDLLDTSEFKKRLQMTVEFLTEHQRPYCQAVAEEQSAFLKSLKD